MSGGGNHQQRARVACFASGGPIALATLEALAGPHDVALVVRPPATRGWRAGALALARLAGLRSPDPVSAWAARHGVPEWHLPRSSEGPTLDRLRGARADVAVIATFPLRLSARLREAAARTCLNVHPSLLPRHRGPGALFWTYHAGDAEGGVTVHDANDAFDAGPVRAQARVPIERGANIVALHARCAALGGALASAVVASLTTGGSSATPQDEARATHAPGLRERRVRSTLATWPAAHAWHFLAGVAPIYRDPFVDDRGAP
ncbi:MAG: hypothetical protein HY275_18960, partial [Gemmatimonadetes bacterium]|nr:hypothetical protein [Gemmatimonadota bacterium]